jgi:thymidylate synthase
MFMYHPIPSQPDCVSAWREAVRLVEREPKQQAQNVLIDIANPLARSTLSDLAVSEVDAFLRLKGVKPIETVANTIFPNALYRRYGAPAFYDRFTKNVLPKAKRPGDRWSGYYFERMINLPREAGGKPINQLDDIITRLRKPSVRARNKFEFMIFDPSRDVDDSPYGGQCLSFGSFKLRKEAGQERLDLAVMYRNHYYIEKLLGNLIGLARLMDFVASEGGVLVGQLTVLSTHATVDRPGKSPRTTRKDIASLLERCDALG